MAFCINCGTQLQEGAKFCGACGAPVSPVAPVAPVNSTEPAPTKPVENPAAAKPAESPAPVQPAESPAPAKSIVTPVPVEANRASTKKKTKTPTWVPVVAIILVFCIAIIIGVVQFKDVLFAKKAVAGPTGIEEVTSGESSESLTPALPPADTNTEETTAEDGAAAPTTTEDATSAVPVEEAKEFPTWALTKENINIRSGAGTNFEKKSKYFRGTIVILYEEKSADDLTWYRVSKDGAKTELWIADDGTWLDFADPSAAALVGDGMVEETNFSLQYTMLAKTSDNYTWRFNSSENNGTQELLLQSIKDPSATESFINFIDSDSGFDFLVYLWEQSDHNVVDLKEITLAGYCQKTETDADGNYTAKKGEVWYAVTDSKTANYFAAKGEDGALKIEEVVLDKLFEEGWESCTVDEYKAID